MIGQQATPSRLCADNQTDEEYFMMAKTLKATRMKTDRRQLDRLLDPENKSVTLGILRPAATALGRTLYVEIE
jgi:hypothetical protein